MLFVCSTIISHTLSGGSTYWARWSVVFIAFLLIIVVYLAINIGARRRAEKALRQSEEMFRILSDRSVLGILVFEGGAFRYVNRSATDIFGYTEDQMLKWRGEECYEKIIHADDIPKVKESGERVRQNNEEFADFIWRGVTSTGEIKWIESYGKAIEFHGTLANLMVISDVTTRFLAEKEQQMLDARIQHSQKLESLGVLAGGIAHDFNNFLMAIRGNADLALMKMAPSDPQRELLDEIRAASIQAAELTGQMLLYSGQSQIDIRLMDLNEIIRGFEKLHKISVSKKTTLEYILADHLPQVMVDADQITQVLINLLTNASEAIGENAGFITISTEIVDVDRKYLHKTWLLEGVEEGKYVSLKVEDDGVGMDKDVMEKLFEPFYSTKFLGRGIGMAAVLGIVRGHNAGIRVDTVPDRGTMVSILLPIPESSED